MVVPARRLYLPSRRRRAVPRPDHVTHLFPVDVEHRPGSLRQPAGQLFEHLPVHPVWTRERDVDDVGRQSLADARDAFAGLPQRRPVRALEYQLRHVSTVRVLHSGRAARRVQVASVIFLDVPPQKPFHVHLVRQYDVSDVRLFAL